MIPAFRPDGILPPGIHWATRDEIVEHFGFNVHRRSLLAGLEQAIESLRVAGCPTLFLDGSFVTSKKYPNDFDGCWIRDGVDWDLLDRELRDSTPRGRMAQKARYGGELFPMAASRMVGPDSWLTFFQGQRGTEETKGIIAISLREQP